MKKEKTIEVKVCDVCGDDNHVYEECLCCEKNFCYDCAKTSGTDYPHAVYASGSGDGYFCHACKETILSTPNHKLYKLLMAYLAITCLRSEMDASYKNFEERSRELEAKLKSLQS